MLWTYVTTNKKEIQIPQAFAGVVNPYQMYISKLVSPNPATQLHEIVNDIALLFTIPGWYPKSFTFSPDDESLSAAVQSLGSRTNLLYAWANKNNIKVGLRTDGFYLMLPLITGNRLAPTSIYNLDNVIANLIDRLSYIIPGNPLTIGAYLDKGKYFETQITISFNNLSPTTLNIVGQQLQTLPLILSKVDILVTNGSLSGSIVLTALGN
jgi:hypothetical protein